jgi:hypothetical protein
MTRADSIRKEILFQAYAVRPLPLSAAKIHRTCKKNQDDFSEIEIARELPFLVDEKLLRDVPVPGITEKYFVITSDGIRHYEQNFA